MIELKNIKVTFAQNKKDVHAVNNVTLNIEKGDIYGIVGYSGAGKSTLVRVINLLQRPTSGEVIINGENFLNLAPKALRQKRKNIGMIFQHFNLMDSRTVFGNVAFPLKGAKLSKEALTQKVMSLLSLVGIEDKAQSYPSQLSGGQKQRVAIARALANDPSILLCDEATSALDPKTTIQILELLKEVQQKLGITIVIITHEMQVVKEICNKVAVMENGEVIESGNVVQIFSQPQKALTQDFIRTATHVDQALKTILEQPKFSTLKPVETMISLSYIGDETDEPLISTLSSRFNVTANILYGNVEIIDGTPIGNLIVTLSGEVDNQQNALTYIQTEGVQVEILKSSQETTQLTLKEGN